MSKMPATQACEPEFGAPASCMKLSMTRTYPHPQHWDGREKLGWQGLSSQLIWPSSKISARPRLKIIR